MKKTKWMFVSLAVLFAAVVTSVTVIPAKAENVRYADAQIVSSYMYEQFTFGRKEVMDAVQTPNSVPLYKPQSNLPNSCGATAGTIAIGYYDKYYPNLIPDYDSYYAANGRYKVADKVKIPAIMNELYTSMRTNVDDVGVSHNDFMKGFKAYIASKGYTVSFTSIKNGNDVNYPMVKQALANKDLIILFAQAGDLYLPSTGANTETLNTITVTNPHIMIGYNYQQWNYFNDNGWFRSDIYLGVETGQPGIQTAFYRINTAAFLEYAYVMHIN